jgi:hypothetical protein
MSLSSWMTRIKSFSNCRISSFVAADRKAFSNRASTMQLTGDDELGRSPFAASNSFSDNPRSPERFIIEAMGLNHPEFGSTESTVRADANFPYPYSFSSSTPRAALKLASKNRLLSLREFRMPTAWSTLSFTVLKSVGVNRSSVWYH